jgi:hypothetical protein
MNWYYAQGEQRQGPVSEADFEALIAAGTITPETLVWKEGMANWLPLREVRAGGAAEGAAPPGWIRCTATGRFFPPEEIVYIEGKPYSMGAKPAVLQGLMQTGALPTDESDRTGPPWENRSQLGFFPAIWQTIRGVMLEPAQTFAKMKREGGLGEPLMFCVLIGMVGVVVTLIYQFAFGLNIQSFMQGFMPPGSRSTLAAQSGANMVGMVIGAVLAPFIIAFLYCFLASGIFHLSLMLCSGIKRPFETTFRTNCYAFGATSILQIVPLCGGLIAVVWWMVALCIGTAKTHEISTGKSVLGILLPVGVCCVLLIVIYGALFAVLFSTLQSGRTH